MATVRSALRNTWEKNWPEVHAAITNGLPKFIFARCPAELDSDVPVFCYHTVCAKKLEAALEFLSRNHYVTINSNDLECHLNEQRAAPARAVVLTFDDGARNLYEVAFPLLKRYSMKAVAFIAPQLHEENSSKSSCDTASGATTPLTWAQIREMHDSGVIDFQSHTSEHRFVPRWPERVPLIGSSPELVDSLRGPDLTIEEDFRLAKEVLEKKLNKTVKHLAFPKYFGTEEAVQTGRRLGYTGFWWGVLPGRPGNRPGQSPSHITRVDGQFLRRLPGQGREALASILLDRYGQSASRLRRFM